MNSVKVLSGIGVKGPACIQLNVNGKRWLLDCGEGPDEKAHFDPAWLEGADGVFVTHDHVDHIAGARHAAAAGVPVYATALTAKALPKSAQIRILPERGVVDIDGTPLTVGPSGHALGGIWMHFAIDGGLFYSGDWSEESDWFVFDAPPQADTAILDCSYHVDDGPQKDRIEALDALVARLNGQILFPVPPSGRAGELALHLMRKHGADTVALDRTCQEILRVALGTDSLSSGAKAILPLLVTEAPEKARFLLCDTPNAEAGKARDYVDLWRQQGKIGTDAHVIFTGHTNEFAQEICAAPGGYFRRWNVHPPLGDQRKMLRRLGAKRFAPAFCTNPETYLELDDLTAQVFLQDRIPL